MNFHLKENEFVLEYTEIVREKQKFEQEPGYNTNYAVSVEEPEAPSPLVCCVGARAAGRAGCAPVRRDPRLATIKTVENIVGYAC